VKTEVVEAKSLKQRGVLWLEHSSDEETDEKASLDTELRFLLEKYGELNVNNMLETLKRAKGHNVNSSLGKKFVHKKPLFIQDSVHGQIKIEPRLLCLIDTPEFQRMRWIHQVGTSFLVCPSASHSRFDHSIGTYHVARTLLNHIYREQRPKNLNERLIFVITTAALVHDIGHGPFSHVFEGALRSLYVGKDFPNHEKMGGMILDSMYKKYEAVRKEFSKTDLKLMKVLMAPEEPHCQSLINEYSKKGLGWIFGILSGPIDVDKLDYLYRDGFHAGLGPSGSGDSDLERVINSVRIIDDQIAFNEKVMDNIVDILRKRWSYHKRLYQHKTALGFDILVTEVLLEYLKVKGHNRVLEVEQYVKLDDSIIGEIRRSMDPELAKARVLLRRVDFREQPRLIWSSSAMSSLMNVKGRYETEEKLSAVLGKYCSKRLKEVGDGSVSFLESDIIVQWGKLSLGGVPGYKNKHPLSAICLYDPNHPDRVKRLDNPQKMISLVGVGCTFVEYWTNIYVRYPHQQQVLGPIVQKFFANGNNADVFNSNPPSSTPGKNISHLMLADIV